MGYLIKAAKELFTVKKYLILCIVTVVSCNAWAKHYFNICYYNWTKHPIGYNNGATDKSGNKVSKDNFKDRGTVVGSGYIDAEKNKCFYAADETIFLSHKLSFIVSNQLLGIVDPAFSKPYVISQNATQSTSKSKLANSVDKGGHDQYYLNVHILPNYNVVLSSSHDPKNTSAYLEPSIK